MDLFQDVSQRWALVSVALNFRVHLKEIVQIFISLISYKLFIYKTSLDTSGKRTDIHISCHLNPRKIHLK